MFKWLKFLALSFPFLLSACAGQAVPSPNSGEPGRGNTKGMVVSGSPSTPIRVELRMPYAPRMNQEVSVEMLVTSVEAVKDVNATIQVPEGVEIVSAQAQQTFNLNAGESRTLSTTIRFPTEGQFEVSGQALSDVGGGSIWGDLATIYLTVGQDKSSFGFAVNAEGQAVSAGGEGASETGPGFETPPDCTQPPEGQPGCMPPPTTVTTISGCPPPASEPATPISVAFSLPENTQMNRVVSGTLVVCALQDAPGTRVMLELPQGVQLAQGDSTWTVDLVASQPVPYTVELHFAAAGQYQIMATALYSLAEGTVWGDSVSAVITVTP